MRPRPTREQQGGAQPPATRAAVLDLARLLARAAAAQQDGSAEPESAPPREAERAP